MKAQSTWATQMVGGESESKKIMIMLGENKVIQTQAKMRHGLFSTSCRT